MKFKKALFIIDVQNDFCPGGALAVPEGDKIVSVINKYIKIFHRQQLPVFASADWHPKNTKHFKKFGGVWPVHCVQNTKGADIHPKLKLSKRAILLYKGMDLLEENSYSAFYAKNQNGMSAADLLKNFGIKEIYLCGLATDYCVKWTAIDALKNGFKVKLLMDAIKGVNLKPFDSENAIKEMTGMGAAKLTLKEIE
ncbi:MAG: bifunctional nicotinamidase/pyrazinamidase [Candidatus Omnitrophota bacterium]